LHLTFIRIHREEKLSHTATNNNKERVWCSGAGLEPGEGWRAPAGFFSHGKWDCAPGVPVLSSAAPWCDCHGRGQPGHASSSSPWAKIQNPHFICSPGLDLAV